MDRSIEQTHWDIERHLDARVDWTLAEQDAVGSLVCHRHGGRRGLDCRDCSHLYAALDLLAPFVVKRVQDALDKAAALADEHGQQAAGMICGLSRK